MHIIRTIVEHSRREAYCIGSEISFVFVYYADFSELYKTDMQGHRWFQDAYREIFILFVAMPLHPPSDDSPKMT